MPPKRTTQNSNEGRTANAEPQETNPELQQELTNDPTIERDIADAEQMNNREQDLENATISEIDAAIERAREMEVRQKKLRELREIEQRLLQQNHIPFREMNNTHPSESSAPASEIDFPTRPSTPSTSVSARTDSTPFKKPPPNIQNVTTFNASGNKELETFMNKLTNHFDMYYDYFAHNEKSKIATAAAFLNNDLINRWMRERKSNPDATWETFQAFCQRETADPRLQRRNAALNYHRANQREYQSVTEFANVLDSLEEQAGLKYDDHQRKVHLLVRLYEPIRRLAQQTQGEPEEYHSYISWLRSVEDNVPGRPHVLTSAKRNRYNGKHQEKRNTNFSAPEDRPRNHWTSQKRKRDYNDDQRTPLCWKCKKGPHPPSECRSAPWKKDFNKPKN